MERPKPKSPQIYKLFQKTAKPTMISQQTTSSNKNWQVHQEWEMASGSKKWMVLKMTKKNKKSTIRMHNLHRIHL